MTTELLCRQSRVPKSEVQLANHAIYLCDNRDNINQGHVFFFVFHFELTPFSDGQLSKVSARPTVFNWEKCWARICTAVLHTTRRRKNFKVMFAPGVVVDTCCQLFFHLLGVVDFFFAHTCCLLRFFFTLVTHTPTLQGFALTRIASHWNVGDWWDQPARVPSDAPSKPLTHQLTPIYPYPRSHRARFLRRGASLNNGSDSKTIAGSQ